MIKLKKILIISLVIAITSPDHEGEDQLQLEKQNELAELEIFVAHAKQRIRASSNVRVGDFLKLFPDITIGKSSPD